MCIFALTIQYYYYMHIVITVDTIRWRRALLLLFAGVLPLCVNGQLSDTLHVSFRPSKSDYDAHYKDNGLRVDRFVEAVKQQAQHTPSNQIQLTVYTGASSDGSYQRNHKLGEQRSINIKQVLDEQLYGIVDDIRLVNRGPRWGEPTATVVAVYRSLDQVHRDTVVIRDTVYHIVQMVNQPVPDTAAMVHHEPQKQKPAPVPVDQSRVWALKTNLALWGVLAPNIEFEIPLDANNQWSIEGEFFMPWFRWSDDTKARQCLNLGCEVRYWLGKRPYHRCLDGWHIGAAFAAGYYNLEWKHSDGYQGEYINPYINIGYQHRFDSHWAVDVGIGVGCMLTKYRHYLGSSVYPEGRTEPHDNHLIWHDNGHYIWPGPNHVNISIVYLFNYKKR